MPEFRLSYAYSDGKFLPFRRIIDSFTLRRDRGAADMLEIKLVGSEGLPDFPSFMRLYERDRLIFDGIVDEEQQTDSGQVRKYTVRNNISLLTDNEIRPCTVRDPSLRFFKESYLLPLGFELRGNMQAFKGELKISEGTSILRAINDFCRKFMGTEPEIRGHIIYCGESPAGNMIPKRLPVRSFSKLRSRYGVASKIHLRNSTSTAYSGEKLNPTAMGFPRVVYGDGKFDISETCDIIFDGFEDICPGDIYGGNITADSVRVRLTREDITTEMEGHYVDKRTA